MKNKRNFDIIIIGGGASGLFCAAMLKKYKPNYSVAILEKQKTVGKKLLATGNGRCNLTNINISKNNYHGTFKPYVEDLLTDCSSQKIIDEFKELGLVTTIDSEGRVYPLSKHSATVLDVLLLGCISDKINIFTDTFVNDIKHTKDDFIVTCNNGDFTAKKIIISTGSKATPETGADDTILKTIIKLGHTITPLSPALCPVNVKAKSLFNLKGVRAQGNVSIVKSNKILKTESGEIQFTDKALSGICLFNLSRIANTTDDVHIMIDLLPEFTFNEVYDILKTNQKRLSDASSAEDLMIGIFQRKLSNALLLSSSINKDIPIGSIDKKVLHNLTATIKGWKFEVKKSSDFTRAQIVAGGVKADEINHKTMESKKINNMFLIGEVVDCDGDCGGYNLHFAFASAYRAAMSISL